MKKASNPERKVSEKPRAESIRKRRNMKVRTAEACITLALEPGHELTGASAAARSRAWRSIFQQAGRHTSAADSVDLDLH